MEPLEAFSHYANIIFHDSEETNAICINKTNLYNTVNFTKF